jgi:hypothetical protein
MAGKVRVTIAVADDHMDRLDSVVAGLRDAGVSVEQTLAAAGAIVGSTEETNVEALGRVAGVAAVEREGTFQLPPPDSPIQ